MTASRLVFKRCAALLLTGSLAFCEPPTVPCGYSNLYTVLQDQIAAFDGAVSAQWSGSRPPVAFAGELLLANGNLGKELLAPGAYNNALVDLSRLQSLGVKAVTVNIPFPILLPSFFRWNGDPGDYASFLNFYQQLASQIHVLGLQMIVKGSPIYPVGYAPWSCDPPMTGLNVAGFYKALTDAQYIYARAQTILNIAQLVKPDYISIGTEPDTEAIVTGKSFVNTPSGYASLVGYTLSQLSAARVGGVVVGAGLGTWLPGATSYIQALGALSLSYIDLHVYPINFSWLNNAISLAAQAHSLGKSVAISEAWLQKEANSEYSTVNVRTNCLIYSRDPFSFWSPLDQQFLNALVKFSFWEHALLLSPYWTKYFYAYLDYSQVNTMTPKGIFTRSDAVSLTAMTNGQLTSTALAWQTLAGPSPPASFLVYATPVCQSVAGGGRVNWRVNAAYDVAYAAFPGSVDLSVAGLPTGATAGFSAASVSPGSAASILTVASGTAAAGAYSLTISGTSAGVTYNATVTFTITGQ
jgi:hypothetical protein